MHEGITNNLSNFVWPLIKPDTFSTGDFEDMQLLPRVYNHVLSHLLCLASSRQRDPARSAPRPARSRTSRLTELSWATPAPAATSWPASAAAHCHPSASPFRTDAPRRWGRVSPSR